MTRAGNSRSFLRWYILIGFCQNKDFYLLLLTLEYSSKPTSASLNCGSKRDTSQSDTHLYFLLVWSYTGPLKRKPKFFTTILKQLYIKLFHAVCLVYQDAFCKYKKKPFPFNIPLKQKDCMHMYMHTCIYTHSKIKAS